MLLGFEVETARLVFCDMTSMSNQEETHTHTKCHTFLKFAAD